MRILQILVLLIISTSFTMAQNKYPMRINMVSVLVEDPVKAFSYYTEVLGFEEVMYMPEHFIAIVRSPHDDQGTTILLEPTEPAGIEIAKKYKRELYNLGIPVIVFSSDNIIKTVEELKNKGVRFTKDPVKTDYGFEAVFDDNNGNYIQLVELNQDSLQ